MSNLGLLLIGGGGHCRAAIDVIEAEGRHAIAGIVEIDPSQAKPVLGYPILGGDGDLADLLRIHPMALVTIGQIKTPNARIRAFTTLRAAGAVLPTIISPLAYVSKHATVGVGSLIMHRALVNASAKVGNNVILNSFSLVEHNAHIGDNVHVSTGARINGNVVIESGCFIGSGAVVHNDVIIGSGSVIGAGLIIRQNVPPGSRLLSTLESLNK